MVTAIIVAYCLSLIPAWRKVYVISVDQRWDWDELFLTRSFAVFFWPIFLVARFVLWFYRIAIARETPGERKARFDALAERCVAENAGPDVVTDRWGQILEFGGGRTGMPPALPPPPGGRRYPLPVSSPPAPPPLPSGWQYPTPPNKSYVETETE